MAGGDGGERLPTIEDHELANRLRPPAAGATTYARLLHGPTPRVVLFGQPAQDYPGWRDWDLPVVDGEEHIQGRQWVRVQVVAVEGASESVGAAVLPHGGRSPADDDSPRHERHDKTRKGDRLRNAARLARQDRETG